MTAIRFDTLQYVKGAEAIGIKREHAEYAAQKIADFINSELSTKEDVKDIRTEIKDLRIELKNNMKDLENRLIIRLGSLMFVCGGITITLLGFILKN